MRITLETSSYNDRRYGKPWIAKIDFTDPKGKFEFGDWVGSPGGEGLRVIDAEVGDILATGQKDHRGNNNTVSYYAVDSVGNINSLGDKGDAYKFYLASKAAKPDIEALVEEKSRLLKRIDEINKLLEE